MMGKAKYVMMSLMMVGVMLVVMALMLGSVQRVQAEPLAIPTPVSVPASRLVTPLYPVTFLNNVAVTADRRSSIVQLPGYNTLDLQWVVDVGTLNTTTLKLQYSNDGNNWVDGASFASAVVADANSMNQYNVYGRYTAVYVDVTNSNPITITLIGVAK